jgi:hypothetical protein
MNTSSYIQSVESERRTTRWLWNAFVLSSIVAVGFFFIPAFIIRPFRHQGPRALLVAMALRDRAPMVTLVAAIACFIFAFSLWIGSSWRRKFVMVLALALVTFSATMSRLNYFEWMFHPIPGAQFLAQSESKLDPKEMVMAVNFGGDARAYPISQMAYHHVLNDVVAGVPIAVTY